MVFFLCFLGLTFAHTILKLISIKNCSSVENQEMLQGFLVLISREFNFKRKTKMAGGELNMWTV